ncbi:MAG: ornithine--oxo-acid transaminase [Candidatus Yanofskybacteria bacterium]|nr:ornithine--oxo-acid transaminase [Candidatus Yanofskybacteria bacterium]
MLVLGPDSQAVIEKTHKFSANNYHPLPVVLKNGKGVYVWDTEDREYIDMLSAYSALNFGHNHPRLVAALAKQSSKLSVTSRAFYTDIFAEFVECLARFCFLDKVLPMNSGAEAVETAIKIARKWGYKVKGVKSDKAEIIVCENNFHGRTTTIVGFSSTPQYRDGFGPFAPGFKSVPFGDVNALKNAITENTVAFLVEPIQGEGGINVPSDDYLNKVSWICRGHNVLFVADEIQTGLGRTGKKFCFWHQCLSPDLLIIGKALGGGLLPVSAVVGKKEVMEVIKPGDHGSTFGGNPLACAVAVEALKVLEEEHLAENALELGEYFMCRLSRMNNHHQLIEDVRGRGLLIGLELRIGGRVFCEKMMELGILCKETRDNVVRLAPPLIVTKDEIDEVLSKIKYVLDKGL